ncbi:unnamed protein product, partial [Staurois parvus]
MNQDLTQRSRAVIGIPERSGGHRGHRIAVSHAPMERAQVVNVGAIY